MRRRQRRRKRSGARVLGTLIMAAALCALLVPCVSVVAATLENHGRSGQAAAGALSETVPTQTDQSDEATTGKMPEKTNVIQQPVQNEDIQKDVQEEEPAAQEKAVTPVEDTYFSDAVFLGDSRTEGFSLYSGLKEGEYLYSVGATVSSVFTKATEQTAAGKVPMLDALAGMECSKIYIMLGVNELGWVSSQTFRDQYAQVIDRIQADHPDATVAIQSILPVSQAQDDKKTYVNNARIREYNALLEELAEEKGCVYLDIASAVSDETGCLRADWTFDGVHLNTAGCQAWLQYLKEHPIT